MQHAQDKGLVLRDHDTGLVLAVDQVVVIAAVCSGGEELGVYLQVAVRVGRQLLQGVLAEGVVGRARLVACMRLHTLVVYIHHNSEL